jgi:hypothetical protein
VTMATGDSVFTIGASFFKYTRCFRASSGHHVG